MRSYEDGSNNRRAFGRNSVAVPDPFLSFYNPDPDRYLTLMSATKLSGRVNLTKYAFWLGPGRPTDTENEDKMYKKYHTVLGTKEHWLCLIVFQAMYYICPGHESPS